MYQTPQLAISSPSLAGSSEYRPHARQSAVSNHPGTGGYSPLFPQLVLPQQHLSASLRAMELLYVRMQPCVVPKPDPQWVLRTSSCQLCREPGIWAKQAGNALARGAGLSPCAGKLGAPHHRSVEAEFLTGSPVESTWLWKFAGWRPISQDLSKNREQLTKLENKMQ